MWFQNRRAKFRRNERTILAQRNQLRPPLPSLEQPIVPRATTLLPWKPPPTYCNGPSSGPPLHYALPNFPIRPHDYGPHHYPAPP